MAKNAKQQKAAKDGDGVGPWVVWPLDKIKPYPHNARTHPPAQITLLANILKKHGPDQPIVVDEVGEILKGHGRRLAAIEADRKDFPVVQRFGLSDAEKRAMRLADNQIALLSGWDNELVKFEMESLKRGGYDLALLGFGEAQLVSFMTTPAPPGSFPTFDENIPTAHECPSCHYRWSGNSAPVEAKAAPEKKPAAKKKAK